MLSVLVALILLSAIPAFADTEGEIEILKKMLERQQAEIDALKAKLAAQEAIGRLNSVAPQIKTELIPDVGHDLTIVQAALVSTKVIEFLKQP